MAAWTGYLIPLPEVYKQPITTSLTDGIIRFPGYQLIEGYPTVGVIMGTRSHTGSTPRQNVAYGSHSAFLMPTYADDLFNHWLIVPEKLALGNLLTNQTKQVEIANLFTTPQSLETVTNNGGLGVQLAGVPTLPAVVKDFDSVTISVSVSTDGPPSINGTIDLTFSGSPDIAIPITGTRITMFPWQPDIPVKETLEWLTDVMISANDTEQRASLRLAPRQRIAMTVAQDDPQQWQLMHNVLFDWMPRVFGVPIWWEQRRLTQPATQNQSALIVDTTHGDFRVGGLVMLISTVDGTFEAFEIDSFTSTQINLTSFVQKNYTVADMVMPVRTAYLSQTPSGSRGAINYETLNVEFLTLDNIDLGDTTGATLLNSLVLLDDPNAMGSTLPESWSRAVTVLDGGSGRVFQTTLIDRSRLHTKKGWALNTYADVWRVRQLLHSFRGSLNSFYLPTYRQDFVLTQNIGGGATSIRVKNCGYTQFVQARAPMNYMRVVLQDGSYIVRRITGSAEDNAEEVIDVDSAFSGSIITLASVKRLELVVLMRMEGDKATFQHSSAGVAQISMDTISIKG